MNYATWRTGSAIVKGFAAVTILAGLGLALAHLVIVLAVLIVLAAVLLALTVLVCWAWDTVCPPTGSAGAPATTPPVASAPDAPDVRAP